MSNKQYKNLVTNSLVFTIANLGSKIISFVMVPLYTYVLTTEEYGTVDLMTTINSLLIPILFLCVSDAVLRYCMDKRYNAKEIISNSLYIYIWGAAIICLIIPILGKLYPDIAPYNIHLGMLFLSNGLMQGCNQYLRASGHVKAFAANGIVYTFVFASLNVLFLVKLKFGISGYLYSMILTNIVCIIVAATFSKIWKVLTFKIYPKTFRIILKYSVPLIPNALMWWIMDASDKLIITYYLGVGATGIFAIAKKLPTLIDTFHSIFNQAWQISAIQENDSSNVKEFTSTVYKTYFTCIILVVGGLLTIARPFVTYALGESYQATWRYIPFLLLSVGCSSLSGFLSANLIAAEQTVQIFKTTVVVEVINTILNFILIPTLGLNGGAIATFVGFLVVLIIRENVLKKQNKLEILFNRSTLITIIVIQIIVYYILPLNIAFVILSLFEVSLLVFSWRIIIVLIRPIFSKFHR